MILQLGSRLFNKSYQSGRAYSSIVKPIRCLKITNLKFKKKVLCLLSIQKLSDFKIVRFVANTVMKTWKL